MKWREPVVFLKPSEKKLTQYVRWFPHYASAPYERQLVSLVTIRNTQQHLWVPPLLNTLNFEKCSIRAMPQTKISKSIISKQTVPLQRNLKLKTHSTLCQKFLLRPTVPFRNWSVPNDKKQRGKSNTLTLPSTYNCAPNLIADGVCERDCLVIFSSMDE